MEAGHPELAARFITQDGVNLWPLVRHFTQFPVNDVPTAGSRRGERMPVVLRNIAPYPGVLSGMRRLPRGACVLLGKSNTFCERYDGKAYDPYLDPIYAEANSAGLLCCKLLIDAMTAPESKYPCLPVPLIATGERELDMREIFPFAVYGEYASLAEECGLPVVPEGALMRTYVQILEYAEVLEHIFTVMEPGLIIFECYYHVMYYAASLVARRMGIPSADCQHGCQEFPHVMYSFNRFPEGGFNLLPEYFFVWGGAVARSRRAAFAGQRNHKVLIAGKPNYIAWKKGDIADPPDALAAFQDRIRGRRVIAVALPVFDARAAEELAAAVAASPDDWLWVFRRHPVYTGEQLPARVSHMGDKVEMAMGNGLILHTLLSHSRHMVTDSSTSLKEGLSLHNLRGTVLSEFGRMYFAGEIRAGLVRHAATAGEILAHCEESLASPPPHII